MPVIDIPGVGQKEFPDSWSKEKINAAAARLYNDAQEKKRDKPKKEIDVSPIWREREISDDKMRALAEHLQQKQYKDPGPGRMIGPVQIGESIGQVKPQMIPVTGKMPERTTFVQPRSEMTEAQKSALERVNLAMQMGKRPEDIKYDPTRQLPLSTRLNLGFSPDMRDMAYKLQKQGYGLGLLNMFPEMRRGFGDIEAIAKGESLIDPRMLITGGKKRILVQKDGESFPMSPEQKHHFPPMSQLPGALPGMVGMLGGGALGGYFGAKAGPKTAAVGAELGSGLGYLAGQQAKRWANEKFMGGMPRTKEQVIADLKQDATDAGIVVGVGFAGRAIGKMINAVRGTPNMPPSKMEDIISVERLQNLARKDAALRGGAIKALDKRISDAHKAGNPIPEAQVRGELARINRRYKLADNEPIVPADLISSSKIAEQSGKQVRYTSSYARRGAEEAQRVAGRIIADLKSTKPITQKAADEAIKQVERGVKGLKREASINYVVNNEIAALRREGQKITPELEATVRRKVISVMNPESVTAYGVGTKAQEAVKSAINKNKLMTTNLFDSADKMAAKENPVFDIGSVKNVARELKSKRTWAVTEGQQGVTAVDVARAQAFEKFLDKVLTLDKTQVNHNAVKDLRTELFKLRESYPGISGHEYQKMVSAFFNAVRKPVNAKQAKSFTQVWNAALDSARGGFRFRDQLSVQQMMKEEFPARLINNFGTPETFNKTISEFMKKYEPVKWRQYQHGVVINKILGHPKGPEYAIKQWDDDALKQLLGGNVKETKVVSTPLSKEFRKNLDKAVKIHKEIDQSRVSQVLSKDSDNYNKFLTLVEFGDKGGRTLSPRDITIFKKAYGDKYKEVIRQMAFHHAFKKSITEHVGRTAKSTKYTINQKELNKALMDLKTSKVWNLLDRESKIKLEGVNAFLRLWGKSAGDAGSILEGAQIITNLKHPSSFFRGVQGLSVNGLLARIYSSPAAIKWTSRGARKGLKPIDTGPLSLTLKFLQSVKNIGNDGKKNIPQDSGKEDQKK